MKPASPGLLALLATRQFYAADLFQFTLSGGQNLYYCGGDADITWNSITWVSGGVGGPYFQRQGSKAKCHWKVGVEVDTLVFDVLPGSSYVLDIPFLTAVQQGVFDGAELTLYRAFMPNYGDTAQGVVTMFVGRVAEIDAGRSFATFTISSHLELLNQQVPRNLYQAGCVNTLFDSCCGLNAETYAVAATVSAGSTAGSINAALSQASGYFDQGKLTCISGSNSGISRTVKSYTQGSPAIVQMIAPFPNALAVGDSFKIYPGCDKRQATCVAKFANLQRFRGFPYIPENATAV